MNKQLFCANCQQVTDHSAVIDQNTDMVLTCSVCERAIKFPTAGMTKADIDAAILAHQDANRGQVSQAAQVAQNDALLTELLG
jgi:transcription elongation factor Elf1